MAGARPALRVEVECEEPSPGYLDEFCALLAIRTMQNKDNRAERIETLARCLLDAVARHGRENTALSWGGCTLAAIELRKALEGA